MRLVFLLFTGLCCVSALPAAEPVRILDGKYMTVEDGHLSYAGKRVQFWGACFCSDVFRGGKDLELCFDRLADVGFNGVRINLCDDIFTAGDKNVTYKTPVTVKGSDSRMDRMDYSIFLARQRGMFFWIQFDRLRENFKPGDYDLLPDDGTREQWNEAIRLNPNVLVYLSPRAGKVYMEYAKNLLDHVNPYTRRRWGDEEAIALWEMFNENLFVRDFAFGDTWGSLPAFLRADVTRRWNDWLRKRYKDDAGLKRAWGALRPGELLAENTVAYAPLHRGAKRVDGAGYQPKFEYSDGGKSVAEYPYRRGEDVVRFACFLYRDYTRKFIRFVRTQGKGAAVVPVAPTGSFERTFAQYYAQMDGDFITNGSYGFACQPWAVKETDPYYPFIPRVNEHPMMEQPMDILRPAGKPYLIYECNDYRPNPYRVEYPLRIATMLIQQDADGVFWFDWDNPGFKDLKSDEDYLRYPLHMSNPGFPNAALTLVNDETMLAAIKGAGALFLDGRLPAPKHPQTAVIGKDLLFDLSRPDMGDQEDQLRHHVWRDGLRLVYDPNAPSKIPAAAQTAGNTIQQGPYTTFAWSRRGSITVNAPTAKAHAGFNGKELQLGEVKITGLTRDFTSIYIVAEDGLPLAESKSILITMSSDNTNTGFRLDPKAMKKAWAPGLAEAVVQPGDAPIITYRVGAAISAPWLKGRKFAKHDFARKVYQTGVAGDSLAISPDEPMFYVRLTP